MGMPDEDPAHQRAANEMFTIDQGHEILKAIFPNYPDSKPCNPCPEWALKR
jgi:hypothetical protein